jgi:hypothetical protein
MASTSTDQAPSVDSAAQGMNGTLNEKGCPPSLSPLLSVLIVFFAYIIMPNRSSALSPSWPTLFLAGALIYAYKLLKEKEILVKEKEIVVKEKERVEKENDELRRTVRTAQTLKLRLEQVHRQFLSARDAASEANRQKEKMKFILENVHLEYEHRNENMRMTKKKEICALQQQLREAINFSTETAIREMTNLRQELEHRNHTNNDLRKQLQDLLQQQLNVSVEPLEEQQNLEAEVANEGAKIEHLQPEADVNSSLHTTDNANDLTNHNLQENLGHWSFVALPKKTNSGSEVAGSVADTPVDETP